METQKTATRESGALTLKEIATECAMFAHDNSPAEPDWDHSPEAMWGSWHDKEGIENPPSMPESWRTEYLTECLRIGGRRLLIDVTKKVTA